MDRTVAFDLDGTLIDVSDRDFKIYSDILKELGFEPLTKDVYWPLRRNVTDIHWILKQSGCVNEDHVNLFLLRRKDLMEEVRYLMVDNLFDDTLTSLKELSSKYKLVILTKRNSKGNTLAQCEWLGLSKIAKVIIVQGNKKEMMETIPNLHAFVGDTENDIIPANELGITSIAVTTGIRNEDKLLDLKPVHIIDSLNQITKIL